MSLKAEAGPAMPRPKYVRSDATVGEISDIFRAEFGVYTDPGWI